MAAASDIFDKRYRVTCAGGMRCHGHTSPIGWIGVCPLAEGRSNGRDTKVRDFVLAAGFTNRIRRAMLFVLIVLGVARLPAAESVSIASAANLVYALESLNTEFKRTEPGIAVTSTSASSGSLFAQIKNGAPFDVFLSADTDYPRQMVEQGLGERTSLRTFAIGRLVLWTTREDIDVSKPAELAQSPQVKKIAIAQPKVAPYGRAAQAALEKMGVWTAAQPKLVWGENITQTAQFVETGHADAGFVALSFVLSSKLSNHGHWTEVSPELYADVPLDHAAVLTLRGAKNPAARRYLEFLASDPAKKILHDFGYGMK